MTGNGNNANELQRNSEKLKLNWELSAGSNFQVSFHFNWWRRERVREFKVYTYTYISSNIGESDRTKLAQFSSYPSSSSSSSFPFQLWFFSSSLLIFLFNCCYYYCYCNKTVGRKIQLVDGVVLVVVFSLSLVFNSSPQICHILALKIGKFWRLQINWRLNLGDTFFSFLIYKNSLVSTIVDHLDS